MEFEFRATQLPEWLPDESAYSWASRYHVLAGHRIPSQTSVALFGAPRRGAQHDLPGNLATLAERTGGRLGSATDIALQRTVLRYYLPARSQAEVDNALTAMASPRDRGLKFRLGLLTSRFRANHPLKSCLTCMAHDCRTHGVAYWHLAHQYPGVWTCPTHDAPLMMASIKSNGVERFGWVLPDAAQLQPALPDRICRGPFTRLTSFAQRWALLPPAALNVELVASACRQALPALSAASAGPLRRKFLAEAYTESLRTLRLVTELSALPATTTAALAELNRWLFAPRGNTHPLRLLAIIAWLFDEWGAFEDAVRAESVVVAATSPVSQALPELPSATRTIFNEAIACGNSVTAAARLAGVAANTGIAWAAKSGLRTTRRPKQIDHATYDRMVTSLRVGLDKTKIASRYGVSLQSVTRALLYEPGLAMQRQTAVFACDQARAREAWTKALARHPGLRQKQLRQHVAASFAWLYRHDRDWLASNQPVDLLPHERKPRVNWNARDVELAAAVYRTAQDLVQAGVTIPAPLWRFTQALSELKAKLGHLNRLPRTRAALDEVARRKTRGKAPKLP